MEVISPPRYSNYSHWWYHLEGVCVSFGFGVEVLICFISTLSLRLPFQSAKDVITAGADGVAAIKCITDGKPSSYILLCHKLNHFITSKFRFILPKAPDLERDLEKWKAIFKKA